MFNKEKFIPQPDNPINEELKEILKKIGASQEDLIIHSKDSLSGIHRIEVKIGVAKKEKDFGLDGIYKPHPKLEVTSVPIGPGTDIQFPAMDSTNEYLKANGIEKYNEISIGNYGYNNESMASFGFMYCDALILRSSEKKDYRGFAHITSGDDPKEYIENLIELFGTKDIEGVVIKAGKNPREHLIKTLQDKGIHIIEVRDIPVRQEKEGYNQAYSRDIIVRPELEKIIINIEELGIQEIDF